MAASFAHRGLSAAARAASNGSGSTACSVGSLRSSSLATSSRVQLQHFATSASASHVHRRLDASQSPASNGARSNPSNARQGARTLHSSPPLDPLGPPSSSASALPPNLSAEPATSSKAASSSAVAEELDALSSQLDSLTASEDHVHVRLSFLHPATKALPLDGEYTPQQLRELPSLLDASATRRSPTQAYVPLSAHVFGTTPRRDLLHAAVVYYLDGLRAGTASTKSRGEVAGSRRKLRPQKGSGKARLGRRNNPLLRGGGVIHGPKPRSFATSLPRRVRELALRSALSAKWMNGNLVVVPTLHWDPPPSTTGALHRMLKTKQWDDALILTAPRGPESGVPLIRRSGSIARPSAADPVYTREQLRAHQEMTRNIALAVGNIQRVELLELNELTHEAHLAARTPEQRKRPGELHAYEVLHRRKLILDLGAVEWLEQKLGGAIFHDDQLAWEDAEEAEAALADENADAEEMTEEEVLEMEEDDRAAEALVDAHVPRQ